ncbi:GTP cyclohydrolase II [Scheffersomyces spartinae]|uniref:GTP cyclohydrolase II n=1 Tax=Scheffersomyces spartinae TaxID=45513 RepID=A0A9P8AK05_9ASCO|nr:GTP cyclohydrolase II [Scheffersomyces spartinae]KAG7195346.1 GTP cyclohydrolase II [Scheffersomyces spartinae]
MRNNNSSESIDFSHMHLVSPLITPSRVPSTPVPVTLSTTGEEARKREMQRQHLPELPQVTCLARARIPTTHGADIFLHIYENNVDNKEHLAIVFGEDIRSRSLFKHRPHESQQDRMTRGAYIGRLFPGRTVADEDNEGNKLEFEENGDLKIDYKTTYSTADPAIVRIHSECYTGETAWSARCDCGEQLDEAGRIMGEAGHGCIVYLRQEGRGIGLGEKLKAYNLQDLGADTVQANLMLRHPADARLFSLATAILVDLGLEDIKLLTNNPDKIAAVEGRERQVRVTERVPMVPLGWSKGGKGIKLKEIEGYLSTKIERMGHLLEKPIHT